jgi:hypothetical protein
MLYITYRHLLEKPDLYQDEMVLFLLDEFDIQVLTQSIGRGRNADLRDLYLHNTADLCSYYYVTVDESGCDKRIGFRRTGWYPLGVTPVQIAQF